MTDLEISRALALAIGWKMVNVLPDKSTPHLMQCWLWIGHAWRVFDYRDPAVIWPIAERYDCFPDKITGGLNEGKWISFGQKNFATAETPSKASALAVIGNNK